MSSSKVKVFIARSPAMADLARVADSVASGSSPVLICGEKGTGKRLFAERLHCKSPRKDKPFVRVNCASLAALGAPLAEKALFERLAQAEGATLFLDEIACLSLELQAALLRSIQEKKAAGVRLVCSTSDDIELLAGQGKFLGDLLARLNALSLRIPPLRERSEDLMPLAESFLKKYSDRTCKNFTGFSDDARAALSACHWPGNVRELKNSVERACVLGRPPLLCAQDFRLSLQSAAQDGFVPKSGQSLKDAMNGFKKFYVEKALRTSGARQADVARALGIGRTYLSRLLVELKIR